MCCTGVFTGDKRVVTRNTGKFQNPSTFYQHSPIVKCRVYLIRHIGRLWRISRRSCASLATACTILFAGPQPWLNQPFWKVGIGLILLICASSMIAHATRKIRLLHQGPQSRALIPVGQPERRFRSSALHPIDNSEGHIRTPNFFHRPLRYGRRLGHTSLEIIVG